MPCFITRGVNSCEHGTNIPLAWILIVPKNKVIFGECNGSHRIHRTIGDAWIHIYGICGFSQVFFGSMVVNEHPQLPGVWPVAVESCIPTSTAAPAPRFPRAPPIYGCSLANNFHQKCRNPQDLYGNLVQNDLLPRNNWNPEIHRSFHQKKQTSRWPKRLCGVVSHEVQDGEHRHECLKRYVRIKGPPKTVGYTKWKHARSPAEIEQKMTKEWSHQGLQVTETNRHSLASTHGAIMNSMNPICEKALSSPCAKVRMESAISVLLLPFSMRIHEIQQNPWGKLWHYGVRFVFLPWSLVFYGAPISPCWPHLLTLSRSFNMPTGIPSSFSLSPWAKNSSTPGRKLGQILWLCIWLGWTSTYYWWLGAIISIIRLFHIQLLFVPSFTDYFDVNSRWLGGPNNVYFYPSMGLKCRDKANDKPTKSNKCKGSSAKSLNLVMVYYGSNLWCQTT